MKFEIFRLLIVGLKAECLALLRNGNDRDEVRIQEGGKRRMNSLFSKFRRDLEKRDCL